MSSAVRSQLLLITRDLSQLLLITRDLSQLLLITRDLADASAKSVQDMLPAWLGTLVGF